MNGPSEHLSDPYGAKMDQGMKGMEDLAKLYGTLRRGLVGEGFTEEGAASVVAAWVRANSTRREG